MVQSKHQRGLFISLEGIEGVGKSTQVSFIREYLHSRQLKVVTTREPGGTPLAEEIRKLLLAPSETPMTLTTELLLMFAARAQHVSEVIQPALAKGDWVLSDRFVDATYAYQGGGRGCDLARIAMLEKWTLADFRPDLTILLDAPVDIALARAKSRGNPDRFEQEAAEFFTRVQAVYHQRRQQEPHRFVLIDASAPLGEVQQAIVAVLDKL